MCSTYHDSVDYSFSNGVKSFPTSTDQLLTLHVTPHDFQSVPIHTAYS